MNKFIEPKVKFEVAHCEQTFGVVVKKNQYVLVKTCASEVLISNNIPQIMVCVKPVFFSQDTVLFVFTF